MSFFKLEKCTVTHTTWFHVFKSAYFCSYLDLNVRLNHCVIYSSLPVVCLNVQLFDWQWPIADGCLLPLRLYLSDLLMCVRLYHYSNIF